MERAAPPEIPALADQFDAGADQLDDVRGGEDLRFIVAGAGGGIHQARTRPSTKPHEPSVKDPALPRKPRIARTCAAATHSEMVLNYRSIWAYAPVEAL